jgi:hypothetical protein
MNNARLIRELRQAVGRINGAVKSKMNNARLIRELRQAVGRINGAVKSKKKAIAARKNGKKGGRPRTRA